MEQSGGAIVWFAVAALLVLVALPLAFIILEAIFPSFSLGSLAAPFSKVQAVLADRALLQLTLNTILLGLAVVLASAVLAVPLGIVRGLFVLPLARLWDLLLLVPFMIPPYIVTLGWISMLQPHGYLQQLTGVQGGPFIFSFAGIVFVMALNVFPAVYFSVSRTIAAVGGRFAEVARVFGASPGRAFFRITLPLTAPGLLGSLLLVFAITIDEYGIPTALGRQSGFLVLVTGIASRTADYPVDLSGASALSLLLVGLSLVAFLLQKWLLARRSFETTSGKPVAVELRALGKWTTPVLAAFGAVAFVATGMPLFAILATALSRRLSGGLALDNLGVNNFVLILSNKSDALIALWNSLALGAATALAAGLIGAIAAYGVVKTRFRGKQVLDALTVIPNVIPGVVIAVGLILAWNQPFLPVSPYNTPLILVLAYCCILLPYPIRYANAAFRNIGDSLEAAARVSGASRLTVFRRVLLPLVWPSLLASMLLVFAVASRELVATVLVIPVGMATVSTFIWSQFEQGSIGLGMAMSAVAIFVATTIPIAVAMLFGRRAGMLVPVGFPDSGGSTSPASSPAAVADQPGAIAAPSQGPAR